MATGKKTKRVVEAEGVAHVNATFNNTTDHDHRHARQHDRRGARRGKAGFKGSKKSTPFAATVAAEQCAREALDARCEARARARAGPGQRPRVGHSGARRGGTAGQVDQGRDADPAQRLPSPEASESLSHGSLYRTELPAVPPRRNQAVPQGHEVLHREVPGRASSVRARPARPEHGAPSQVVGVLQAAAREAEDQAHLRREREAVPQHVREGRDACPASRATTFSRRSRAVSTTSCIAWASPPAARPRVSSSGTATSR